MCDMQKQGLNSLTIFALQSVLDLVSWESICKCVTAMALHTAQMTTCQYPTLLEGFSALLVFQGTLVT